MSEATYEQLQNENRALREANRELFEELEKERALIREIRRRAGMKLQETEVCGCRIVGCRCGGLPWVHEHMGRAWVRCRRCGEETDGNDMPEAIRKWNERQEA